MQYFIRTPKVSGDRLLGPYGPIETLQKARQLRGAGIEFFVTDEDGIVVVNEDHIRRSEK